jgi:hypothetical protein
MISIRNIASLAKIIKLQPKQMASFADSWKDRDEAAEKVYITRAESIIIIYHDRINNEKIVKKDRS